jgi:hypothetical protein
VTTVARLSLLGSVDAEQANTLTPELRGVAIRDKSTTVSAEEKIDSSPTNAEWAIESLVSAVSR